MVECELPKLNMRVRFPLPAPISLESLVFQGFFICLKHIMFKLWVYKNTLKTMHYSKEQLLEIFDPKHNYFKENPDAFWACMIALNHIKSL